MANRFLNNIKINDSYTLPPADGTADQIIKTDGLGQLSFINQGDVVAGEADKALSLTIRVKNTESVALTKGQVVCAAPSATPPSGNVIEVKLADNDGTDSMPAIGVLNEGLDAAGGANDEGEAIMFGRISGIDTSAFAVGDEVFVSDAAGALTATKPTGVKYIQKIGVVIRDDATNGTIEVFGAGRTNDVPTPLYIDHANQRLGIRATNPAAPLTIANANGGSWNDGLIIDDPSGWAATIYKRNNLPKMFTGLYSGNDNYIWMSTGYDNSGTTITAPRADAVLMARPGTDDLQIYLETHFGNNVGIGTASPTEKLQVNGNIKFGGTTDKLLSSNGYAHLVFDVDGGFILGDEDYNYSGVFIKGDSVNYRTDFEVDATTVMRVSYNIDIPSYIRHLGDTNTRFGFATNDTFLLQTAGSTRLYIGSNGNVGVGKTTGIGAKLDVAGGVRVADDTATASASNVGTLRYRTSGNNSYVDMCMQTGATTYAWINIVQNNW